ncbi:hypothetical protein SLS53_008054 [Cytospora paraplurivora]|uniref:STAS domain-containing protein n=1 Tax=Cytospora paraplurivora TaxID=2898453 RepID=A0AAN9YDC2_9PEZI
MSTIMSQVAMTMGGSLFPGALGAMLIEVLPFMRGVASDIRDALGDDSPSVVPTVMFAYALSSFLIGIVFLLTGALGLGRWISYFPQPVLTGAIGGIGVSLFILGLELTLPSSQTLTLSNAGAVLFSDGHVGLLMASLLPIVFLCFSVRSSFLSRITWGAVEHPWYVPIFILMIGLLFWIVVGAMGLSKLGGLDALTEQAWLFSTGSVTKTANLKTSLGDALNYWSMFNFKLVDMSALGNAVTNFVLLVVIGVLNLPVYVPALALALDVPYSMNHELIGQGAANILSGCVGSVPNVLQLSYSVFFTRAGGKRIEAAVVIALTVVLYITSSLLLRYIPTILASGLVLFLGIELTLESVFEASKHLMWSEWLVNIATLFACTFLGFAPGVGVGICAAFVAYTGWGCFDLRAKNVELSVENETRFLQHQLEARHVAQPVGSALGYSALPSSDEGSNSDTTRAGSTEYLRQIKMVRLDGYVFFGAIPSMEEKLASKANPDKPTHQYIIVDMGLAHRVETAAARLIKTKARDTPGTTLVVCGLKESSGTAADLRRSGITLSYPANKMSQHTGSRAVVMAFRDPGAALEWCKYDIEYCSSETAQGLLPEKSPCERQGAIKEFFAVFGHGPTSPPVRSMEIGLADSIANLKDAVASLKLFSPETTEVPRVSKGDDEQCAGLIRVLCIISGGLTFPVEGSKGTTPLRKPRYNRIALSDATLTTLRWVPAAIMDGVYKVTRKILRQSTETVMSAESDAKHQHAETRRAGPGDIVYISPADEISSEQTSSAPSLSEKTRATEKTRLGVLWDSTSRVNAWPRDCAGAVADDSTPCWLVEISIRKSAITSPLSEDRVCQEAVRLAQQQLREELSEESSDGSDTAT